MADLDTSLLRLTPADELNTLLRDMRVTPPQPVGTLERRPFSPNALLQQVVNSALGVTPEAVQDFIAPAPNTTYGSVLPFAKDNATGDVRWWPPVLPQAGRDLVQGVYDLTQGPRTGTVTPEASMALLATVNPLARPREGVLSAFGGSKRALREAELREKAAPATALDRTIAATEEQATPAPPAETPIVNAIVSDGIREADRVSTRVPTAVAKKGETVIDPHTTSELRIGIDAARAAAAAYDKNSMYLRSADFPDLPTKGLRNPGGIAERAIDHMTDNLVWLHDQMKERYGEDTVNRAAGWYDGAHKIAMDLSARTGYSPAQVAAVMANLSPQKDWYQNADLGDRLIDIVQNGQELQFTPEMHSWAQKYAAEKQAEIAKERAKGKHDKADKQQESLDDFLLSTGGERGFQGGGGPTFGEMTNPRDRAIFVRAYDEAHHSRNYPVVMPEGNFGPTMTNDDGTPSNIGWGSFHEIGKAIEALDSSDLAHLSRLLGGNHKVRSFYNNIISPNSRWDDTTIDTHAINAAHLRPMGGSHGVVKFGLGMAGSPSAAAGTKGGYGLYHEAYRRAGERLGLLPRQVQSITWEAVRGLFTPEQKRDDAVVADVDAIWQQARNGQITADDARNLIRKRVGDINAPSWYTGPRPPPRDDVDATTTEEQPAVLDDGTIMAGGNAVGRVKFEHGDKMTRIADIQINPSSQNRGLGTAAIRQIQQEAARRGNPVVLSTDAMRGKQAQADQRRLYERLGFVPNQGPGAVGERVGNRRVVEELVWMPPPREEQKP